MSVHKMIQLQGDKIVIEIPFSALQNAWDYGPRAEGYGSCAVTDPEAFGLAVFDELRREEEDGSTALHRMLDKAMERAVEYGCEGITCEGD